MNRIALGFLALLAAAPVSGTAGVRHLVFTPAREFTEIQRASLAARGIVVQKALTGGRFIVSVDAGAAGPQILSDAEMASAGELQALPTEWKIDSSVARELSRGALASTLRVVFHEDATFDEARDAVSACGGSLRNPLQVRFGVMRSVVAVVPSERIAAIVNDERVLAIAAASRFPVTSENANEAALVRVTTVQDVPYSLQGDGVVVSLFELREPQTHREFDGRLTVHSGESSGSEAGKAGDESHATHVAGTIAAAGYDGAARGMAPRATLHSFIVEVDDRWLEAKASLPRLGVVADNNSWGYVLGWGPGNSPSVVWNDYGEYYGAYSLFDAAPIDRLARETGVLFVHSAGNDGVGPYLDEWSRHLHREKTGTYCYSKDGSGTDCPGSLCTASSNACEVVRHTPLLPYGTLGVTAAAKNVIAVGNVIGYDKTMYPSSSRGPARDGRVKPDLVAPGATVYSTLPPTCAQPPCYGVMTGTSMAAPVITGAAALVAEQWRRTFGSSPVLAELKTLLIAGAEDLGNSGPDYTYGFGLIDARASVDLIVADGGTRRNIRRASVATGESYQADVTQSSAGRLKIVLQWTDPEAYALGDAAFAEKALVNDLDLKVIGPTGTETLPFVLDKNSITAPARRAVNSIDNTEVVEIANAPAGTYRAIVTGKSVTDRSPQEFVLVSTAPAAGPATPVKRRSVTRR